MKKITKSSLDELAKMMPVLSHEEEYYILGGGDGTKEDPYTVEEYERMVASGTWHGGFVCDWGYTTAEVTVTGNQRTVTGYRGVQYSRLWVEDIGDKGSYSYNNIVIIENGDIYVGANVFQGLGGNYTFHGSTYLYVNGALEATGILTIPPTSFNESGWLHVGSASYDLTQYHGKVEIQLELLSDYDYGGGHASGVPHYKQTVYSAYRY
jgi:hypothetical protein